MPFFFGELGWRMSSLVIEEGSPLRGPERGVLRVPSYFIENVRGRGCTRSELGNTSTSSCQVTQKEDKGVVRLPLGLWFKIIK